MSVTSYDAAAAGARPSGSARPSNLAPVLRVEHLSMRFGGLVAINDFSFAARRGDITALIGPNGAGKTTVFNCITGFYKPSEGRIALQFGDPGVWDELSALTERGTRSVTRGDGMLFLLERMPDYLVAHRARVARTFQNIRLFQGMTVLENLLVAQHNSLMWASGFTVLGALGLIALAALATQRHLLASRAHGVEAPRHTLAGSIDLFRQSPILLCFAYFAVLTLATIGIQTFAATALNAAYAVPLALATSALTAYLLGSTAGILAGGFLAGPYRHDHSRHDCDTTCDQSP